MSHELSSEGCEAQWRLHPMRRIARELLALVLLIALTAAYVAGFAYHASRLTVGGGVAGGDRLERTMEGDPADFVARAEVRLLSRPSSSPGTRLLTDF